VFAGPQMTNGYKLLQTWYQVKVDEPLVPKLKAWYQTIGELTPNDKACERKESWCETTGDWCQTTKGLQRKKEPDQGQMREKSSRHQVVY
jgi:hypothetical protein